MRAADPIDDATVQGERWKMTNPVTGFLKKLRFWLFEEREFLYSENPKRRKQLNDAYLIQAWAALTGIIVMAMIPLIVWLITVQDFVLVYLIASATAFIVYLTISLHIRRLNKRCELN